ncbi:hypothetical protein H257_16518 [Aphanomyces astaci]|uniref:Uncharacterized protein n=1 Tax=Aphanomyces astaci TaxID=112090 RepID=W4FKC0_APHAT|nr:hypothetical protein H257_16518 [Aphanomyces astaci]ETV67284.1 hypothetical protein H257_16518 [Aphanomyces astaci]|eukprot:XP_009843272.1 hypothetical protein H257_16518 [Aphanomyces astaci]
MFGMLVGSVFDGLAVSTSLLMELHSLIQQRVLEPPTWPLVFEASFSEAYEGFSVVPSSGRWYYHYNTSSGGSKRWRVDHLEPQRNNFCGCVLPDESSSCQLFFTPDGLYVNFPALDNECCRLCTAEGGCSPLKPDWLSRAHPTRSAGADIIDGRQCYQYCTPGAQFLDCMSYDAFGWPCRYSESWSPSPTLHIVHNLTFTSWTNHINDPHIFDLPMPCQTPCPRQFPACMNPN